jgi:putative membrane-bound dehydrogenase-like protein
VKLTSICSIATALGALCFPLSQFPAHAQGLTPEQALAKMETAPGFEVKLFASEPEVRQPVAMYFDERGRMWVVQYLQYPTPAGLKPVKVDNFLRTTYDKIPEPPPKGPTGVDRITICEDTDGDGKADKFKDFLSNLNMATGIAVGRGGVFVLQSPYLLFYPDKNHDDAPDGDPEVLLSGFGMEDAHAYANSLQWGPDGWLYGTQGSTVTAHIRGIEFQQGIWRYQPETKEFELFSEGGGNTWGLDFDADGQAIAGTNFGDVVALHQAQGAYYLKNFGKHGELHNPYSYGYFDHIPFKGFQGGHVTAGGIVYNGGLFPSEFNGSYIAANVLANTVYWHRFTKDGSTFRGEQAGTLLNGHDPWFRPVDCAVGPDGAVYIADWHDKRATHLDSKDTWDRSNGRIYRIAPKGAPASKPFDLGELSTAELVTELANPNNWHSREARRLLAERADASIAPILRRLIWQQDNRQLSTEAFWALAVSAPQWKEEATDYLHHYSPVIREWVVRLLGDDKLIPLKIEPELLILSQNEANASVRSQLACSARRFSNKKLAVSVIFNLLQHDEDARDQHIPLLLWWALEPLLISEPDAVLQEFKSGSRWKAAMTRSTILERIGRRLSSDNDPASQVMLAKLYDLAPGREEVDFLSAGVEKGLATSGAGAKKDSKELIKILALLWNERQSSQPLLRLNVRAGNEEAISMAAQRLKEGQGAEPERVALMDSIGSLRDAARTPLLLDLLNDSPSDSIKSAALNALQKVNEPALAAELLQAYPRLTGGIQRQIASALTSRKEWAAALVQAVETGKLKKSDISLDQVGKLNQVASDSLKPRIEKIWGKVRNDTAQEKVNFENELKLLLRPSGAAGRDAKGDLAKGRELFNKTCAVCHKLFDTGNAVGPELTSADRKNLDSLLANIVNPSGYIRPEYAPYQVDTKDGQSIAGIMVESTPGSVTLLTAANQKLTVPRDQIEELKESNLSLMPEGLLESLSQDEITDLFAYLQSDKGK